MKWVSGVLVVFCFLTEILVTCMWLHVGNFGLAVHLWSMHLLMCIYTSIKHAKWNTQLSFQSFSKHPPSSPTPADNNDGSTYGTPPMSHAPHLILLILTISGPSVRLFHGWGSRNEEKLHSLSRAIQWTSGWAMSQTHVSVACVFPVQKPSTSLLCLVSFPGLQPAWVYGPLPRIWLSPCPLPSAPFPELQVWNTSSCHHRQALRGQHVFPWWQTSGSHQQSLSPYTGGLTFQNLSLPLGQLVPGAVWAVFGGSATSGPTEAGLADLQSWLAPRGLCFAWPSFGRVGWGPAAARGPGAMAGSWRKFLLSWRGLSHRPW